MENLTFDFIKNCPLFKDEHEIKQVLKRLVQTESQDSATAEEKRTAIMIFRKETTPEEKYKKFVRGEWDIHLIQKLPEYPDLTFLKFSGDFYMQGYPQTGVVYKRA